MSAFGDMMEQTLQNLLAVCGIGIADIRLDVNGMQHPRGQEVRGYVHIQGGSRKQILSGLQLTLKTFTQQNSTEPKILASVPIANSILIEAHEHQSYVFTLHIPDDARLTRSKWGNQIDGCVLEAGVLQRHAWSIRHSKSIVTLNVTRHREIEAVLTALHEMDFRQEAWFMHHLLRPDENEEITETYSPPPHLADQLNALSIFLQVTKNYVTGKILLELPPHNLTGHVKSLVGGNRQEHPILIPRKDLLTPAGYLNVAAAIPHIRQILSLALALPDDPKSWMLRASMAPQADPGTLLRPTMPHESHAPSDSLLRPTQSPKEEPKREA